MSKEFIGQANHIFPGTTEITALDVKIIEFDNDNLKPAVTIGDENESLIVHDLAQWRQLNALVLKAFDGLEE